LQFACSQTTRSSECEANLGNARRFGRAVVCLEESVAYRDVSRKKPRISLRSITIGYIDRLFSPCRLSISTS
jgi:hypothetical protein